MLVALDVMSDVAVPLDDDTSGAEVAVDDAEVAADEVVPTEDDDNTGEEVA
jgi:hypothetical protein